MSSVSGASTTGSANTHTSQHKHKQAVPRNALTVPTVAPPNANYSHSTAVAAGKATVYLCGMMGDLPGDGRIISGGVAGQMTQIMRNVKAILEASGSSLGKIVQRRIYLVDMGDLRPC
ncbi:endoribonuclease L-PSP protein [Rutstroemia sp. NJR-2017a BBW]|nr:endoribonuclease L-PSP protein [Rutstroemia sp. NJR-2017a BBW]